MFGDTEVDLAGLGASNRMFALAGDAFNVTATGHGGDDLIRAGNDVAFGDAVSTLFGVGGNDTLFSDAGDSDVLAASAHGGNDQLGV